jgi:dUTP pyrophosphatase
MLLKLLPTSDNSKRLYGSHETFHEGDSGCDLFCISEITIPAHETLKIDLEIQCEAESEQGIGLSYYLYPRSSISKTPLRLANSVGIIDAGYRGNLLAVVDNRSDSPYTVCAGQRLFQLCAPDLSPIRMVLVNSLSESTRGSGGIGSTGV